MLMEKLTCESCLEDVDWRLLALQSGTQLNTVVLPLILQEQLIDPFSYSYTVKMIHGIRFVIMW